MKRFVLPSISALCIAAAIYANTGNATSNSAETYRQWDQLVQVYERVRDEYVESVDDSEMVEAAINGMLSSLDPHSSYMGPESVENMQMQTSGQFGGLGIEVTMEDGLVKVIAPIDDTPAAKAGLQGGDFITHIDGEQVYGMTLPEALKLMRGDVGEPITVTILREETPAPFDVTIIRDTIQVRSVRHRIENDNVGYIRIASFNKNAGSGVRKAMSAIKEEVGDDLAGVVLDLRGNPGGLLDQAVAVSDAFLDKGEVVSTRGRRAADIDRYNARNGDIADGLPVVVLINAYSASASEIVAGALQAHRRGTVIGTQSFGKGTVQTIIPLSAQSAIRLTTARYYTPSGLSIQEYGITPDIIVEQPRPEEFKDLPKPRREADLRNHLANEKTPEELADEQLEDAPLVARTTKSSRDTDEIKDYKLGYAIDLIDQVSQFRQQVAMN
ncbi:MAG: S41 family peptidase [Sphingomonadales bacterium]